MPLITRARKSRCVSSKGANTNTPQPHKIPEAKAPAIAKQVHHTSWYFSTLRRQCTNHNAKRRADKPTIRLTQIATLNVETTGARTNPSRTLFRTEIANLKFSLMTNAKG